MATNLMHRYSNVKKRQIYHEKRTMVLMKDLVNDAKGNLITTHHSLMSTMDLSCGGGG